MKIVQIDKSQWMEGLEKLTDAYRVYAPVKYESFHDFKALDKGDAPDFDFKNTRRSPKSVVYPQSEILFRYSLDKNSEEYGILKEDDKDKTPKAVIGIRPCDAYSFHLVKRNFDTDDYQDPYWLAEYHKSTFIGMACNAPCATCFCTSAGTGPYEEQCLDALVVDAGDHYLAKLISEKGENLFEAAGWTSEADASAESRIEELKAAAESKVTSTRPRSGRKWLSPASTAVPAPMSVRPAGALTSRMKPAANPAYGSGTGTPVCTRCLRSMPPAIIPGAPSSTGSASGSCIS